MISVLAGRLQELGGLFGFSKKGAKEIHWSETNDYAEDKDYGSYSNYGEVHKAIGSLVDFFVHFKLGHYQGEKFEIYRLTKNKTGSVDPVPTGKFCKIEDLSDSSCEEAWNYICKNYKVQKNPKNPINLNPTIFSDVRVFANRVYKFFEFSGQQIRNYQLDMPKDYKYIKKGGAKLDFLSQDTLWELKCEHNECFDYAFNQTLCYYLIGLDTDKKIFSKIKYLGVYNPIYRRVGHFPIDKIPEKTIEYFRKNVIGM